MYFLSAKNLSKSYLQGERLFYALREVNIAFPRKGFFAIVGKSGSGKSTLLNLLSGLDSPSGGTIFYQGQPMQTKSRNKWTSFSAMVFQHYNLISNYSVIDNVTLPLRIKGAASTRKIGFTALKKVGLVEYADKNVDLLSGGQKQRVAIARALVSNPKVIFADEPTGALDEANAMAVMGLLQDEAKKRLVILVSHNEEYVQRYCQGFIRIKDGRIVEKQMKAEPLEKPTSLQGGHGRGWGLAFLLRNLKENLAKNVVCLLSGVLGFAALLVTLGFYTGNETALSKQRHRSLLYQTSYLYEQERFEVENSPLSLLRQVRPQLQTALDLTEDVPRLTFENDYAYFFPSAMAFTLDEVAYPQVRFAPVYDLTLKEGGKDLLKQGRALEVDTMGECIVNEEFVATYGECLDKTISVSAKSTIESQGRKEDIYLDFALKIVGIVSEFSFLNSPRVYYSYKALEASLAAYPLENIGIVNHVRPSLLDFLRTCPNSSSYLNYRYLVFAHDSKAMEKLFPLIEELEKVDEYGLENEAYTVAKSFSSLSDSFMASLILIVGIASGGLALIMAMMAFSTYVRKKKESAILLVLGARQSDLLHIFAWESCLLCFLASLLALLVSKPIGELANRLLQARFGMDGLIDIPYRNFLGVPLGLFLFVLLGAAIFGYLVSFVPLQFARRIPLAEVLRDE